MKHVQAADVQANFPELLAEVERGETLVIMKEGAEVAKLVPPVAAPSDQSRRAFRELLALRKQTAKVSVEEILQWRDEGRR